MIRTFALAAVLALTISHPADAKTCKKGKPCGNSCIAQSDVCHKDGGSATADAPAVTPAPATKTTSSSKTTTTAPADTSKPAATTAPATSTTTTKTKTCKTGKACGDSCIPAGKECHVQTPG